MLVLPSRFGYRDAFVCVVYVCVRGRFFDVVLALQEALAKPLMVFISRFSSSILAIFGRILFLFDKK